jgi:hypothetical protein
VYSANDGGLYRGFFDGKKWQWRDVSGFGMNNMQLYGIAVAEDFSVVPGGTQDLGTMLFYQNQKATKPNLGGDGTDCAVDKFDPNYVYGISWALGPPAVHRSTNAGLKWAQHQKGITGNGDTYYFQLESHENGYVYAGTKDVFRLPHKGDVWEPLGDVPLPTDQPFKITAMSVAPSDANVIYAYGDQLYKTENADTPGDSVVWQPLGEKMGIAAQPKEGGGIVSAVETSAANPQKVWVAFRTYHSPYKVYFSGDGGENWVNVSAGLPQVPVNALAFQAGSPDALYAGTDVGVYYNPRASDPASEWLCFNSGLPVCIVTDLEMNYCFGKIVAGTFGRGVWESPFATPSDFQPMVVREDTEWNFKILRSDVIVQSGTTLTLKGEIRVATGRQIFVEKNSVLVLDGAHIKDLCGQPWQGIVLDEDQPGFIGRFFGARPASVESNNGAIVENAILNNE